MIRIIEHDKIDKRRWDACIDNSAEACVYASSWYLDIVCPGWKAMISDEYTSVFPLCQRKKFGISYLFQPPYTQQLGLFNSLPGTNSVLKDFLCMLAERYRFVEIQLNYRNSGSEIPQSFSKYERLTHLLDLRPAYPDLEKNFSENTLRNIRRFQKSGMKIISGVDPLEIITLFSENKGAGLGKNIDKEYTVIKAICDGAGQRKLLICNGVRNDQGKLIAGAVFLKSHQGYILLFTGLNQEGKETGCMSGLLSNFINEHSGRKGTLDFEGSMDPGIARFYKSFGSHEIVYLQIRLNRLPLAIRWLKK